MMIFDAHADTLYEMGVKQNKNPLVTMETLQKGGVAMQVMALWTGPQGNRGNVQEIVKKELEAFEALLRSGFKQVFSPDEASDKQVSLMLSVEGGEVFEEGLHTVTAYREKGVRMAALLWNNENSLGFPAKSGSKKGLTAYGLKVAKEMQRLKMAVDVSHLNERGFYDLFLKTDKPPMASHSCCAALFAHFRNLTDGQIKLMISGGGYIGINFYPYFLKGPSATLDDLVRHIDHVCQLGGQKHVGFGSDFDGIETLPKGMESPALFGQLIAALREKGYGDDAVADIAGRNLIAYFSRIA